MTKNHEIPITDSDFIGSLIPQKRPMVMVDKMMAFGENFITAGLTLHPENIFVKNTYLQESGILEHIAQSIALYTGYRYYLMNKPAPTGYIGAIKTASVFGLPKTQDQLVTKVSVMQEFAGVT